VAGASGASGQPLLAALVPFPHCLLCRPVIFPVEIKGGAVCGERCRKTKRDAHARHTTRYSFLFLFPLNLSTGSSPSGHRRWAARGFMTFVLCLFQSRFGFRRDDKKKKKKPPSPSFVASVSLACCYLMWRWPPFSLTPTPSSPLLYSPFPLIHIFNFFFFSLCYRVFFCFFSGRDVSSLLLPPTRQLAFFFFGLFFLGPPPQAPFHPGFLFRRPVSRDGS